MLWSEPQRPASTTPPAGGLPVLGGPRGTAIRPTVVLDDKEPDEETRRRDRQQKGGPVGVVQAAQHRGPDEHEEDRSGEHLRDTPFQDGFRVGREDIGRASRSAFGARCSSQGRLHCCADAPRLHHDDVAASDGEYEGSCVGLSGEIATTTRELQGGHIRPISCSPQPTQN